MRKSRVCSPYPSIRKRPACANALRKVIITVRTALPGRHTRTEHIEISERQRLTFHKVEWNKRVYCQQPASAARMGSMDRDEHASLKWKSELLDVKPRRKWETETPPCGRHRRRRPVRRLIVTPNSDPGRLEWIFNRQRTRGSRARNMKKRQSTSRRGRSIDSGLGLSSVRLIR